MSLLALPLLFAVAAPVVAAPAPSFPTVAPDVPHDVVLAEATVEAQARAHATLAALLAERSPKSLAAAMGERPAAHGLPVLLGTGLSRDVIDAAGFDKSRVVKGDGHVVIEKDLPLLDYDLVGARSPEQRAYLAERVLAQLPPGAPDAIRPATFDELAVAWYYIGWDLDEPLLVATWGDKAYAFDFDAAGERIAWIERTSEPCVRFGQHDKPITDCYCLTVFRQQQHWEAHFQPKNACPK